MSCLSCLVVVILFMRNLTKASMNQLEIIRQSSCSPHAVVMQFPCIHHAVLMQSSGSCQAVVRQSSGSRQAVFRQSSKFFTYWAFSVVFFYLFLHISKCWNMYLTNRILWRKINKPVFSFAVQMEMSTVIMATLGLMTKRVSSFVITFLLLFICIFS